jgi:hypothetical protein
MSKYLLTLLAVLILAAPAYAACSPTNTSCNTTVTGRLESGDCVFTDGSFYDQHRFTGTTGQIVVIDMKSTAVDTYLALIDPSGNVLDENDDHDLLSTTTDSQLVFTLTSSGTWTIIANSFDAAETGDYTLSLKCGNPLLVNNNQYRVTVAATDPNGKTEVGVPNVQTNLFGWFSLPGFTGNAGNPELFTKVIGPVNGVPWIFYAGLTNLAYEVNIQEVATNQNIRNYVKLAPSASRPNTSFGDFDVAGNVSQSCADVTVTSSTSTPGTCTNSTSSFCLLNRFRVTLQGKDNPTRSQNQGPGQALPINNDFGFFSIPALSNDPTNIESFVKMVDGRIINNRYWVFLGGLTDFELTITVVDTTNGATKTYVKPAGSTCGWNDTSAFQ